MNKDPLNSQLYEVFDRMDLENIQYCLLRDFDQIPLAEEGGEIDLLVGEEHFSRLRRLLNDLSFVSLPSFGYAPHFFFVGYNSSNGGWLKLDVITKIQYGRPVPVLQTRLADHCLAYREKHGCIYIPSPEDELFTLLLHCILDKGVIKEDRQDRLSCLVNLVHDEEYLTRLLKDYWAPQIVWPHLYELITEGNWDAILNYKALIHASLERRSGPFLSWRQTAGQAARKFNKWFTGGRPFSLMVALLAPDGAGKSALASGIRENYYFPVKTNYMGLYPKRKVEKAALRIPGIGFAWRIVGLWWRYLLGLYHRSRGRLVVFDRYPYDALLSQETARIKKIRHWLLAHACPSPDLIFLLDAPGEILFGRKKEHDIQFLDNQRQAYLSLLPRLSQMRAIDATLSIEEVRKQVIARIWMGTANRQSGFKPHNERSILKTEEAIASKGKVAYIVSRFPKLTETFVLYEMIAIEQCGVLVELYPLMRERTEVIHPEAKPFMLRAHFSPLMSWPILKANLSYFSRKPGLYLNTLFTVLKGTWGSPRMFTGALGIFPISVYFAFQMASDGITHVHAHFARHAATAGFVIHRMAGIPYSFTAHGSDIHCDRHMLREKVAEADFVVPISEFNRKVILEECKGQYNDKLKIIHCGVDTQQSFMPHSWTEHQLNGKPISIICIGTLHEVKGQSYLIEACKILRDSGYHFVCHLVGDGPDRPVLVKQVAASGLDGQIVFHGLLTRPEVLHMLKETDIAVTPSVPTAEGRREGIPIVLMEAMASEVPVVASDLSGIPELVDDYLNGFLVPARDSKGLAAAIGRLIQDPDMRQRFGIAGRKKVEREFDLERNAALLAQHFHMEKKQ